jgi:Protein of unknown function (DUF995)
MKAMLAILAAVTLTAAPVSALAGNGGVLPEGAVPLTPAEVQAIYVGHSVKYDSPDSVVSFTWKPGGTILGTWEGKKEKAGQVSPADGTWSVSDNQICFDLDYYSTDTGKSVHHDSVCKQWWKVGKNRWVKNVKDQPQYQDFIYQTQNDQLVKGDLVSARYAKFKAKLPHS